MRRDLEKLVAQHVFAEYCTCAEDWIPWKKILSEEGAASLKGRRSGDAKDCFLEALAFGAGFCEDQWDKELSAGPFQVQNLLQIRANAYSMVGACHLMVSLQRQVLGILYQGCGREFPVPRCD